MLPVRLRHPAEAERHERSPREDNETANSTSSEHVGSTVALPLCSTAALASSSLQTAAVGGRGGRGGGGRGGRGGLIDWASFPAALFPVRRLPQEGCDSGRWRASQAVRKAMQLRRRRDLGTPRRPIEQEVALPGDAVEPVALRGAFEGKCRQLPYDRSTHAIHDPMHLLKVAAGYLALRKFGDVRLDAHEKPQVLIGKWVLGDCEAPQIQQVEEELAGLLAVWEHPREGCAGVRGDPELDEVVRVNVAALVQKSAVHTHCLASGETSHPLELLRDRDQRAVLRPRIRNGHAEVTGGNGVLQALSQQRRRYILVDLHIGR
mmetsp:Transcript_54171/g.155654  ORF Transcript_54171/g.155654 Transcript_54171/m.155654 type:complete len:320 (-) Transcript_54171:1517-2476(-)